MSPHEQDREDKSTLATSRRTVIGSIATVTIGTKGVASTAAAGDESNSPSRSRSNRRNRNFNTTKDTDNREYAQPKINGSGGAEPDSIKIAANNTTVDIAFDGTENRQLNVEVEATVYPGDNVGKYGQPATVGNGQANPQPHTITILDKRYQDEVNETIHPLKEGGHENGLDLTAFDNVEKEDLYIEDIDHHVHNGARPTLYKQTKLELVYRVFITNENGRGLNGNGNGEGPINLEHIEEHIINIGVPMGPGEFAGLSAGGRIPNDEIWIENTREIEYL